MRPANPSGEERTDSPKRQKVVAESIENVGRGYINRGELIAPGQCILSVPLETCWSVPQALEDADFLSSISKEALKLLDPETILALYLLFVRDHQQNYEQKAVHIAQIPKTYMSAPMYNKAAQLGTNSSFDLICKQILTQIEQDYALLSQHLKNWSFGLYDFYLTIYRDDFKWALCTIQSRSMDFLFDGSHLRLLCPDADMLNHSFTSNARHQLNLEAKAVEIASTTSIASGEQVDAARFN
jgi:hypothetical protein